MPDTTTPRESAVRVREDWNDSGTFDGPYDDLSADVFPGVTIERGRDQGRVVGGPKVPVASWRLFNESRRYSTAYSGSPIYTELRPGHKVEIAHGYGSDAATMGDTVVEMGDPDTQIGGAVYYPVFTGYAEEPKESLRLGTHTVDCTAYGTTRALVARRITVLNAGLLSYTTGQAMEAVFQAAGLAASQYVIDPATISTGYLLRRFFVDDEPAWDVCRRIWATESPPAALYEDAYGRIHFEGHTYRLSTARCLTVQQTFTDTDHARFYTDIEYEPSYASVINAMNLEVEQRAAQPTGKVWEYGSVVSVPAGATVDLLARVDDPLISIAPLAAGTDYVVTFGSLSSASVTPISPYTYRVRLVGGLPSGANVGPVAGNTGIQIRAERVTVISTTAVTGTFDTAPSQATYGRRDTPPEISSAIWKDLSPEHGSALVDGYLVAYADPRALVRITVEGVTGELLWEVLNRQISDRIHVDDSWSTMSLDVTIEQMNHTIEHSGRHRVVLTCERVVELNWARWDVGRWDVDRWGQ